MRALAVVGVIGVGLSLACCFPSMTPEEKAAYEEEKKQEKAASVADRDRLVALFKGIDTAITSLAEAEVPCSPERIKALVGEEPKTGSTLNWNKPLWFDAEHVHALATGAPEPKLGMWSFLSWEYTDHLYPGADVDGGGSGWFHERYEERPDLIVVYVADDRAEPIMEGDSFTSGGIVGWLTVWDRTNGEFLCQAPFEAENSEEVSFRDRGALKQDPAKVIKTDLEDNVKEAVTAARQRITQDFKLGMKIFEM